MSDTSLHSVQLQTWLQRLRAGDRSAADELFRATGSRIERLARRMLRGFPNVRRLADTGDVCQLTALRLMRTLRQLDPVPHSVRDFLGLVTVHIRRELLDLGRHCAAAKRRGEVAQAAPNGHPDPPSPLEDPSELERWQRFHEEIEQLPAEEREVMGLVFYQGWTQTQIAALFEVDERTVRRRWRSACIKLREALGDQMPQR